MVLELAAQWTNVLRERQQYETGMFLVGQLRYNRVVGQETEVKFQFSVKLNVEKTLLSRLEAMRESQIELAEDLAEVEEKLRGESAKWHTGLGN